MELSEGFHFSQGSLQDYKDCHRRFYLRYIQRLSWPAVESEPMLESERYAQRGKLFHKMIHQHLLGIPSENIDQIIVQDDELEKWWHSYLDFYRTENLQSLPALYPEITLSAPIDSFRLTATFDLIARQADNHFIVYDWKTNRKRTPRIWLERRMQTRVYPYLLSIAGKHLNDNQPVSPEDIRMVYWFAEFPQQPEIFAYNSQSFDSDHTYLEKLIQRISNAIESDFHLTKDESRCQYCVYRSLCNRGEKAGSFDAEDDMDVTGFDLDAIGKIDIDQIAEIEY